MIFEPNSRHLLASGDAGQGRQYRESERNYRLIRRRPLVQACREAGLTEVTVTYRFLVPGMVAGKTQALDSLDRALWCARGPAGGREHRHPGCGSV